MRTSGGACRRRRQKASRRGLAVWAVDPLAHRTLEIGLRAWVAAQTALTVAYVEQLYTFGDRGRHARAGDTAPHIVSVGYLALTRLPENVEALRKAGADFSPWYRFFPWEDWRTGRPAILDETILPRLAQCRVTSAATRRARSGCGFVSGPRQPVG